MSKRPSETSAEQLASLDRDFRRLAPALRALALRVLAVRGLHPEDAEDVAQTAVAEAIAALPDFRGRSDSQLVYWFGSILHHRMANFIRSDQRRHRREGSRLGDVDPASAEAIDVSLSKEMVKLLRAAINRLPARQRRAIRSSFFKGKDLPGIARELKVSVDAARMVRKRALLRLRTILRGGGGDSLTPRRPFGSNPWSRRPQR